MVDVLESDALEAMRKISDVLNVPSYAPREPGWASAEELAMFWNVSMSTAFRRADRGVREGILETRWVMDGRQKLRVWRSICKEEEKINP